MIPHRLPALVAIVLVLSACQSPQTPDCSPQGGFDRGRAGEASKAACDARDYRENWQLGQTLGELERERAELLAREGSLDTLEQMRLRVLSREIPELETLARLRGFMPAADLPE